MIKLFQKIFTPKPVVTVRPLVTREYIQSRLAGVDLVRTAPAKKPWMKPEYRKLD